MLFAARAFAGACAGNIAAAQAYIADVTPPEKRANGMGMIGAAFGLGFIIGPALGGVIAGNDVGDRRSRDPGLIAAGAVVRRRFSASSLLLRESLPPSARSSAGAAALACGSRGACAARCSAGCCWSSSW